MASSFLLRRLTGLLRQLSPSPILRSLPSLSLFLETSRHLEHTCVLYSWRTSFSRSFCSGPYLNLDGSSQGPTLIDYSTLLQENEFHRIANSTIHHLLEKLEEFGDNLEVDGFDVDYGNEVLTLKLGASGTYVLNKQTPNRQIWLSSPVSGPSRFDWDQDAQAWVYRRTKANLVKLLEGELEQLCGEPIDLS